MSKRSNGEGSIYKRMDGRWCAACYIGIDGMEKRSYVYGKTQKEVKDKLKQLHNTKYSEKKTKFTLADWMDKWLVQYKKLRVKETTYANYKQIIKTHIDENEIGKKKLDQIDAVLLQKYIDKKSNEITMYQKKMSPRMVRYIATLINGALEQAQQLDMIEKNPMKNVILPAKQKKEIQPLTEKEVKKLLAEAAGTPLYLPILVEVFTGLRRGELLGLRWEDVNFEQEILYVRNNLARVPVENVEGKISELKLITPKTQKSKRNVPLTKRVVTELLLHKRKQEEMQENYADIWVNNNLIFCKKDGDFLEPRDFLTNFQKLLEKAGIRKCRFHDMRHTFASMLLNEGENLKMIQELLGHTTITTTADIYSHLKTEKKLEAVSRIDKALW